MLVSVEDLIQSQIYQVNLVLWMLQPSTGVNVNNVLCRAGYELRDIEVGVGFPVPLASRLKRDGFAASDPARPDLLLRTPDGEYLVWECKGTMFGSRPQPGMGDSQVRQARSLLLQTPKNLASGLALDETAVRSTHVVYLSRDCAEVNPIQGVLEIRDELHSKRYETTAVCLLGLFCSDNKIMMKVDYAGSELPGRLDELSPGPATVHECDDPENDPRPLYLLPWMPDAGEERDIYAQAAFGTRLLSHAAAVLGRAHPSPPCEVALEASELLNQATSAVFEKWRDADGSKRLLRSVKNFIKEQIDGARTGVIVDALLSPSVGWKLAIAEVRQRDDLIEAFRKWAPEPWQQLEELTLFDVDDAEID